jgi:hypothetical protein
MGCTAGAPEPLVEQSMESPSRILVPPHEIDSALTAIVLDFISEAQQPFHHVGFLHVLHAID